MRSLSDLAETVVRAKHLPAAALVALFVVGLAGTDSARAAAPPVTVNYQGVLRNAQGAPYVNSIFDVSFRFMDAVVAGNEIMLDQHTIASGTGITVTNGLFNVALGSGLVADGSGPGTYSSLDAVFRDYSDVWLEVKVNNETLAPRTPIRSAPYALNSASLGGHSATEFINTTSEPQEKSGQLTLAQNNAALYALDAEAYWTAINAYSQESYALFAQSDGQNPAGYFRGERMGIYGTAPEYGVVGTGNLAGVVGNGGNAGGSFYSSNTTTDVAAGIYGIHTTGQGSFGLSKGVLASGFDTGIEGYGNNIGGYFRGTSLHGIYATGPDHGVDADGGNYGGYFEASNIDSYGVAAFGDHTGVFGKGHARGGYFTNFDGDYAHLADAFGYGILAHGTDYGGHFDAASTGNWAELAVSSWKVRGVGMNSFVQNHPTDPSKVVVYISPEGDEAAVYTRGSGRLVEGTARVKLGETFALVANPDIGLTATVTPRGEPVLLAVAEVSPGEIVVRGPVGSDAEFDYMVWGLRIGFEEVSIVEPKERESKIPSMHAHEEIFNQEPGLRKYTALARFKDVEASVRGMGDLSLARADALREAIGVSPYRDPAEMPEQAGGPFPVSQDRSVPAAGPEREAPPGRNSSLPAAVNGEAGRKSTGTLAGPDRTEPEAAGAARPPAADLDLFATEGAIEPGDVVSLTPTVPGAVTRSVGPGDVLVVGCARVIAPGAAATAGQIGVATGRMALCRADASFGAVAVGDRLTASPLPGVAMRADPGVDRPALLGRAIDPLPAGSGLIRVLLGGR